MEGLTEQRIGSVPKSLDTYGILKLKLQITGFQTILKLIENNFNNLLFGYNYGCSQIGRNNSQDSSGSIMMLKNLGELVDCIVGVYGSFS